MSGNRGVREIGQHTVLVFIIICCCCCCCCLHVLETISWFFFGCCRFLKRWSAFHKHMSWHCRQARWQKRWGSFVLRLRLAMQWGEKKVRILPPASKYAIVVSKANLPSNVHVICYKFCFSSVTRGQRVTDHILFGTPGTLLDWILRRRVFDSKKIKMFVLDDADVMMAVQGNQDQSMRILKSVNCCIAGADLGGGCRGCAPPPPLRWPAFFFVLKSV